MDSNAVTQVLELPRSRELLARDIARLAYVAPDGTPRAIPIGFSWNGETLVMCTPPNAPKIAALERNPAVALTIDTEVHPPTILLIRGTAELDATDGIPDEFVEANTTYEMTAEQRVEWEVGVRSLYADGMVRIVVTPAWAKLIDFETTLPIAVEQLMEQQAERPREESERVARLAALRDAAAEGWADVAAGHYDDVADDDLDDFVTRLGTREAQGRSRT